MVRKRPSLMGFLGGMPGLFLVLWIACCCPAARAFYQRRLSYIINCWSYSTGLLAWEWFNEVDLTPISDEMLIPWIQEMTTCLRQRDVYHHLTLDGMDEGAYRVTWYDPQSAQWIDELSYSAHNSSLTIPIPPFRYDLAAKISRIP